MLPRGCVDLPHPPGRAKKKFCCSSLVTSAELEDSNYLTMVAREGFWKLPEPGRRAVVLQE
jgi:hypothetical protein